VTTVKHAVFLIWLAVVGAVGQTAAAETIDIELDRAQIVRLPERVATLIIGNPSVADGTLQTGGLLVVTGKGYGTTNVIALDAKGDILAEHIVTVRAPRDGTLTVWRGAGRETWSCAPRCERSVMLGDAPEFFDSVVGQTGARNGHAAGQAPASK
jgi:Flp pilus assembly secretin CpaC